MEKAYQPGDCDRILLAAYVPLVLLATLGMLVVMAWADYRRRAILQMFDDYAGRPSRMLP